jgi:type I restriction enzyme S subunit
MSKDVKNVPALRFKGYSDAWEKRKLREVSDVRDGTHASPKYYSQGYPLVTSKNLTSAGLDFSNISLISELDYKNINKRSRVDKGDILFGMIGTIGTPVMVHESNFAIKNVALIKEREAVLNSFLVQLLKSPAFINYIRNENVGGTQKFLSLNTIRNFRFSFPTSKEQAMVSRFLEKIDSLIAATQRRIDDLEQVEKTLLQHLFDQSWRFNVYSDPWVKSKVANMAKENFGGGTPSTKKRSFWTGSLPWIQSSDLDKSNKYTVIPKKFISSAALKSSAAKKVPSNSIAVVTRVGVGKLAFINYDYATSQDFLSFSFLNWSAFFFC